MPEAMFEGTRIHQTVIRVIKGDITELDVDAFVYYAQPDLALGSGMGTAISVRGGAAVAKELNELGSVATGEAVVSTAGALKAKLIIHAVGPRFQEEDTEGKLRTTVLNALKRAEEHVVERIAFPAMGVGYYGVPADLSARVMLDVFQAELAGETTIKEIIICVLDTRQLECFQASLAALAQRKGARHE